MKVYFDDTNDFNKDLDNLVCRLDRYDKPLIVFPTEKDVQACKRNYIEDPNTCHITFISYDYWLSKKWIADDEYDHIDFFRMDQFFMSRSYGVPVGVGTMRRVKGKKKEVTDNV